MYHEDIYTRVMPLPGKVGGFVVRKDNVCTIVVNENHNREAQLRFYQDEVNHMARGDLDLEEETADSIEMRSHEGRK